MLKIRELVDGLADKGGVVFSSGTDIVQSALRIHLAMGRISGGLAFVNIYDGLRRKGFGQMEAIQGALDGAEYVAKLEADEASRKTSASTPPKVAHVLALEYLAKTGHPAVAPANPPVPEGPYPMTAASIRGIATEAAREALKQQPKAPTFEDSLSDHERQCLTCRETKLNEWNKKQGVK